MRYRAAIAEELARLPAQPLAAMQVLRLVEDPLASSADLARVIEADPALAARVMRLANAPYYGLTRRVGSAARAVVLLGFSAVRAIAVSAASSLLSEEVDLGPAGFWSHSVTTAIGASVIAKQVGGPVADAFSAGLLHDLGMSLPTDSRFEGLDHAAVGATALELWRFPRGFVQAVSVHHDDPRSVPDSLGRILIAGEALALTVEDSPFHESGVRVEEALDAVALPVRRLPMLRAEVERQADGVARLLRGTS